MTILTENTYGLKTTIYLTILYLSELQEYITNFLIYSVFLFKKGFAFVKLMRHAPKQK